MSYRVLPVVSDIGRVKVISQDEETKMGLEYKRITMKILYLKNVPEGEDAVPDGPIPEKPGDQVDPVTEYQPGRITSVNQVKRDGRTDEITIYLDNGFYLVITRREFEEIVDKVWKGEAYGEES